MITYNAKKILVTSLFTIGIAAGATVAAPLALAEHGCHSTDHHHGDNGDQRGQRGSHGSYLMPNGATTPLGCIPGSMTRPCEGGDR
ncbi:hypothetical protein [Nocardia heshunensis]